MTAIEDHDLFIAIIDQGSFYKAAEHLKISASSLSRQLKQLEKRLAVQLLNRTTRSQSLTQAGKLYLDSCRRIQEEKRATRLLLQNLNAKPEGSLRITATSAFCYAQLIEALSHFSLAYPDINYQLTVTDKPVDIVEAGFDLAIRIGELRDSRLKSRRLLPSYLIPCASPDYIHRQGMPEYGDELLKHQFVYMNHLPSLEKRHLQLLPEMHVNDAQKKLVVNDILSIYQAVKSGMGISMLPSYLIKEDIRAGRLVELFSGKKNTPHEVFLLFPSADFMPLKLRVFIDFMLDQFVDAT
jgi:DNA-binding transcriptional LysR family regulator